MDRTVGRKWSHRATAMLVVALLVTSLLLWAVPASAGTFSWSAFSPIPSDTGNVLEECDIVDIDVHDADIIYVGAGASANYLYRTSDGGLTWSARTVGTNNTDLVAVAPDHPDIVAYADKTAKEVFVSTDGGLTWSSIGGPTGIDNINDMDMSAASVGIHYLAVAGVDGGVAKVWTYNISAAAPAWRDASALSGFGTYTTPSAAVAVAYSPNFPSDQVLLVLVADYDDTVATDYIYLLMFSEDREMWNADAGFDGFPVTVVEDTGIAGIDSASLALGPDYQGSDDDMRLVFVGLDIATDETYNGIHRAYNTSITNLEYGTDIDINSVAYDGSVLVAGRYDSNICYYCTDPTATTPDVDTTRPLKRPGMLDENLNERVVVAWAGDNVVAGTRGDSSAFAVSTNGGKSFNDISLIDTVGAALGTLEDVAVSSDGSVLYLSTYDTDGLSLWRYASAWERVLAVEDTAAGTMPSIIRLAPDDADVVYVAERHTTSFWYSRDVGTEKWIPRTPPYSIQDLAVESEVVVYALNASGSVSKSENAGFAWGPRKDTNLSAGYMISSVGEDNLLVGSQDGYVAYSTDGNSSWTKIPQQIESGATNVQATATGLAPGEYIYAASSKADTKVLRWRIGTSTAWEDMAAPTAAGYGAYGIVLHDGVLYVANSDATANSEALRTLDPNAGTVTWSTLASPGETFICTPSALRVSAGSATLWGIDTTGAVLFSYTILEPDITVSPSSIDFGSIIEGSSSSPRTVTIANDGNADLTIGPLTISGTDASMFSIQNDNASGQTLAPDASATLQVVFSPTSISHKSATLSIPSSDPHEATVNLALSGIGKVMPVGGEAYPVNKVSVLAPWIALCAVTAVGASTVLSHRRAQSEDLS